MTIKLIDEILRKEASYHIVVDRDMNDDYFIDINELSGSSSVIIDTDFDKLTMDLIAHRSKWSEVIGWRNIFGIKLKSSNRDIYIIGYELVKKHDSRGGYISMNYYVYDIKNQLPKLFLAIKNMNYHLREEAIEKGFLTPEFGRAFTRYRRKLMRSRWKIRPIIFSIKYANDYLIAEYWTVNIVLNYLAKKRLLINFQSLMLFDEREPNELLKKLKIEGITISSYNDYVYNYIQCSTRIRNRKYKKLRF